MHAHLPAAHLYVVDCVACSKVFHCGAERGATRHKHQDGTAQSTSCTQASYGVSALGMYASAFRPLAGWSPLDVMFLPRHALAQTKVCRAHTQCEVITDVSAELLWKGCERGLTETHTCIAAPPA